MITMHFIIIFSLLLLHAASGSTSENVLLIPSFRMSVEISLEEYQRIQFRDDLKEAAELYLLQSLDEQLHDVASHSSSTPAVSDIELQVVEGFVQYDGIYFVSNMLGEVSINKMFPVNQSEMYDMVNLAFDSHKGKNEFLGYLRKLDTMNGIYDDPDNINVVISPNDTTRNSIEQPTIVNSKDGRTKNKSPTGQTITVLCVAVSTLIISLFVYAHRDQKRYKKGHLLIQNDEHSDFSEEDGFGRLCGEIELDETSYDSLEDEDGIQFIPIPARIDSNHSNNKSKVMKDVTARRFVKPGSPFELLYGAAFSHRDQAKVAIAHGMKPMKAMKQKKSIKVSGKTIKKKEPLKPMLSISEVNEDEVKAPAQNQGESSFFPQIMSTISSYWKDSFSSNSNQKEDGSLVYRDFPRHDGTPCVMFTLDNDVDWKIASDEEQQRITPVKGAHNSTESGTNDKSPEQEKQIDSFVDRLENLMAARTRQYEERKELEREMVSRRKERLLKRSMANREECASLLESDGIEELEELTEQNTIEVGSHSQDLKDNEVPIVASLLEASSDITVATANEIEISQNDLPSPSLKVGEENESNEKSKDVSVEKENASRVQASEVQVSELVTEADDVNILESEDEVTRSAINEKQISSSDEDKKMTDNQNVNILLTEAEVVKSSDMNVTNPSSVSEETRTEKNKQKGQISEDTESNTCVFNTESTEEQNQDLPLGDTLNDSSSDSVFVEPNIIDCVRSDGALTEESGETHLNEKIQVSNLGKDAESNTNMDETESMQDESQDQPIEEKLIDDKSETKPVSIDTEENETSPMKDDGQTEENMAADEKTSDCNLIQASSNTTEFEDMTDGTRSENSVVLSEDDDQPAPTGIISLSEESASVH